jgi:hypothetical protein
MPRKNRKQAVPTIYSTPEPPASTPADSQAQSQPPDSQVTEADPFRWTNAMVLAALDEAIQQDSIGKRAGQGFKPEAWVLISAAAQEAIPLNSTWKVTVTQTECKLESVLIRLLLFNLNANPFAFYS